VAGPLPNAHATVIDRQKLTGYLLALDHPVGGPKAVFFHRLGFRPSAWIELRDALLDHAKIGEVVSVIENALGKKYIVQGPLAALNGRVPLVRSVWFVEPGEQSPRLVTAYPIPGA
jgi:hypothetical protein